MHSEPITSLEAPPQRCTSTKHQTKDFGKGPRKPRKTSREDHGRSAPTDPSMKLRSKMATLKAMRRSSRWRRMIAGFYKRFFTQDHWCWRFNGQAKRPNKKKPDHYEKNRPAPLIRSICFAFSWRGPRKKMENTPAATWLSKMVKFCGLKAYISTSLRLNETYGPMGNRSPRPSIWASSAFVSSWQTYKQSVLFFGLAMVYHGLSSDSIVMMVILTLSFLARGLDPMAFWLHR